MVWGNLATGYWLGGAAAAGLHWIELGRTTLGSTSDNIDVYSNTERTGTSIPTSSGWSSNTTDISTSGSGVSFSFDSSSINETVYYDLQNASVLNGSNLNNSKWVLRGKLVFTNNTANGTAANAFDVRVALHASTSFSGETPNGDGIWWLWGNRSSDGIYQYLYSRNGSSSAIQTSVSDAGSVGANTWYFEISRTGDTTVTFKLFSDSSFSTQSGSTVSLTGASSDVDDLRYLHVSGFSQTVSGSGNMTGTISELKIYDNASTVKADLTAKPYMMVLGHRIADGACNTKIQLNGDTGSNYARRASANGAADFTDTSGVRWDFYRNSKDGFFIANIMNQSDQEKLMVGHHVEVGSSGAASAAPDRDEETGKWANTSDSISSVKMFNDNSGSFAAGSECVVLGYDPDDTEGTSVWEELKSTTASGSSTTLDSGTFTAKKYLMIECYGTTGGSNMDNIGYRVNSDSGSNYARRVSHNGGSDSTSTSQNYIRFGGGSAAANDIYVNTFIINKSDKEKLFISECNRNRSTGAGNAPDRFENTSKWANTSAQITSIQLINDANNWTTDSFIKVWGFD